MGHERSVGSASNQLNETASRFCRPSQAAPAASYLSCNVNRQESAVSADAGVICDPSFICNKLITPKTSQDEMRSMAATVSTNNTGGRSKLRSGLFHSLQQKTFQEIHTSSRNSLKAAASIATTLIDLSVRSVFLTDSLLLGEPQGSFRKQKFLLILKHCHPVEVHCKILSRPNQK